MANPTQEQINRIISGKDHAKDAADYADTIVVEAQLVSGENYNMVWSNQYNGSFVPDAEQ